MDYKNRDREIIESQDSENYNIDNTGLDVENSELCLKPSVTQVIFGILLIITAAILIFTGVGFSVTGFIVASGIIFLIGIFLLSYNLKTLFLKSDLTIEWSDKNSRKDYMQNENTVEQLSDSHDFQPKKGSKTLYVAANILWAVLGGAISALAWLLEGCLWCITIIGIPLGKQCFKFAELTLSPFGKDIVYTESTAKTFINILWLIFTGLWSAIAYVLLGIIFCLTIIGIPFGLQYFKFAKLMLMPFGAKIINKK